MPINFAASTIATTSTPKNFIIVEESKVHSTCNYYLASTYERALLPKSHVVWKHTSSCYLSVIRHSNLLWGRRSQTPERGGHFKIYTSEEYIFNGAGRTSKIANIPKYAKTSLFVSSHPSTNWDSVLPSPPSSALTLLIPVKKVLLQFIDYHC